MLESALPSHAANSFLGSCAIMCDREKQLAAVKVSKDDVSIIAAEFELDSITADRRLREHNGSLIDALQSYL